MRLIGVIAGLGALALSSAVSACPAFPGPEEAVAMPYASVSFGAKPVPVPKRHIPVPAGPLSGAVVRLARGPCYGTCPVYSLELRGDGRGTYKGDGFVLVSGVHHFSVPPGTVRCLVEDFRAAAFWSLANEYSADVTDMSTIAVSLQIGGETKTVTDYVGRAAGMPASVTGLEAAIDAAAPAQRWTVGDAGTAPALAADGFDFRSDEGAALLAEAARRSPDEVVLALIERGAPTAGRIGERPLEVSRVSMRGAAPSPIESAVTRGRLVVVQALIAHGALGALNTDQANRLLFRAAASGNVEVLREILKLSPDVNARTSDGWTTLMAAAGAPDPASVEDLLKRGVATNTQDRRGKTALMAVSRAGSGEDDATLPQSKTEVVRLLLAAGADPRLKDDDGETALFYAATGDIVRMLVKAGAPVEGHNGIGYTPLISAGSDDAAMALIEAGADIRAVEDDGRTVVDSAKQGKWTRTLEYLHAHGMIP
jgi:ankyrin repeat protein